MHEGARAAVHEALLAFGLAMRSVSVDQATFLPLQRRTLAIFLSFLSLSIRPVFAGAAFLAGAFSAALGGIVDWGLKGKKKDQVGLACQQCAAEYWVAICRGRRRGLALCPADPHGFSCGSAGHGPLRARWTPRSSSAPCCGAGGAQAWLQGRKAAARDTHSTPLPRLSWA